MFCSATCTAVHNALDDALVLDSSLHLQEGDILSPASSLARSELGGQNLFST